MANNKILWFKKLIGLGNTENDIRSLPIPTSNKKQEYIIEYDGKENLNKYFYYDDANIEFPLVRKSNGERVGYSHKKGARVFTKNRQTYLLARLVWIYFNGDVPEGKRVLHRNKNKLDNRIDNLYIAGNKD